MTRLKPHIEAKLLKCYQAWEVEGNRVLTPWHLVKTPIVLFRQKYIHSPDTQVRWPYSYYVTETGLEYLRHFNLIK